MLYNNSRTTGARAEHFWNGGGSYRVARQHLQLWRHNQHTKTYLYIRGGPAKSVKFSAKDARCAAFWRQPQNDDDDDDDGYVSRFWCFDGYDIFNQIRVYVQPSPSGRAPSLVSSVLRLCRLLVCSFRANAGRAGLRNRVVVDGGNGRGG